MMYRDELANDTDALFWPKVVAAVVSQNWFEARKSSGRRLLFPIREYKVLLFASHPF